MLQRIWQGTFGNDFPSEERGERLRLLVSASTLLLMMATLRLWWPDGGFPQVPWLTIGCVVPVSVDRVLMLVLAGSLICVVISSSRSIWGQWSLLTFTGAAVGLILLNQQRTQPWIYQLILMSVAIATVPNRMAFGLLRLLTVGIYFHSGLSKLDFSFCTDLGASFWQTASGLVFGSGGPAIQGFSFWPLLFPFGEIVIAAGLIWPRTRRIALWAACGMHAVLLLVLSPWGLNHRPGVLLWNLFFILQDLILFARSPTAGTNSMEAESAETNLAVNSQHQRISAVLVQILIAWAVIWPFTEPWGWCEVWPAWGLYAEHGEQLVVKVTESGYEKLPRDWRNSAIPIPNNFDPESEHHREWRLRIRNVSLEKTGAPVYPANRFLLGVALQIADEARLESDEISAEWELPANRWSGIRETRHLTNLVEMRNMADGCWFNAKSRE